MKKAANSLKEQLLHLKRYLKKAVRTPEFYLYILFTLGAICIFYINAFHEQYPDEFDNILGGKLILEGSMPYSGFFSHHGPVPYFLAAVIELVTGPSFVKLRIVYSLFLSLFVLGTFMYLRNKFGRGPMSFYAYFILLLGIASTYFWGHMLIADSLAAFMILPAVAILSLTTIYKKELTLTDTIIISLAASLTLLSALTYLYVVLIIYAYSAYIIARQNKFRILRKDTVSTLLVFASPYLIYVLYLFISGSLNDYVTQSIIFNQKYYIYNYPGQTTNFNPLRYAVVITQRFYNNFAGLIYQIPTFNFAFPFNITLALASVSLASILLVKRKFTLVLFLFGILIFANARSNPLDSQERDYQSAVYIVTSLFSLCLALYLLYKELRDSSNFANRVISTFLLILLGVYSFMTIIFLFQKFSTKAYDKYMGTAPLIYDRSEVAQHLNQLVTPQDTMWYGPLEFREMLFSNGRLPSKFHMLIPGIGRSRELQDEMLREYQANPPKMLWFNNNASVLGQTPGQFAPFFPEFLNREYITIREINKTSEKKYTSVIPVELHRDFETMLYIKRDKMNEVLPRLIEANIIKS